MKQLLSIACFTLAISATTAGADLQSVPTQNSAQSVPTKFAYQAVVRDPQGNLIPNRNIGIRVTILQENTQVYQELHSSRTNANGLFSLQIGNGFFKNGNLDDIEWNAGKHFIQTEIDLAGGTSYTLTSAVEVLSVPLAMHAQTAQRLTESPPETDPLFTKHIAYSITEQDTARWNSKAGSETDPMFASSVAKDITGTHIQYWNKKLDSADLQPLKTILQTKADTAYINAKLQNLNHSTDTALLNTLKNEIKELKKAIADLQTANQIAEGIANGTLVKDIDGNVYKTQKYGTQTWMIENLRVSKYNDGTPIDYVQDSTEWTNKISVAPNLEYIAPPMYCFKDTTTENRVKYGASYTWFVIEPTNGKQLCPDGWRVPALNDWEILQGQLIKDGYNFDGTTTENKIAKSMAVGNDWQYSDKAGCPGNPDFPEKKNSSNFSVYPVGDRWYSGQFMNFGSRGVFWSVSTRTSYGQLLGRHMSVFANYEYLFICPQGTSRSSAHSIRCLKN